MKLTEETVGFQIAPRLNTLGAFGWSNPAIDLLSGFGDEGSAGASWLNQKNENCKIVRQFMKEARPWWIFREIQVLVRLESGLLMLSAGRLLEGNGGRQLILVLNEVVSGWYH